MPRKDNSLAVALIGAAAVVIAAAIGYFATHQNKTDPVAVDYTVKVKDAKSHKPIVGAKVNLSEEQKAPQPYYSDSDGVVYLRLSKDTKSIALEVTSSGYQDYSKSGLTVHTGSQDIFLEPRQAVVTKPDDLPKPVTWCDHSPAGAAYQTTFDFWPHEHLNGKTEGGDPVNPGAGWYIEWQAPGPVYNTTFRHDGSHMEAFECGPVLGRESVAFCHGWKNGGNFMGHMFVQWKQPCPE